MNFSIASDAGKTMLRHVWTFLAAIGIVGCKPSPPSVDQVNQVAAPADTKSEQATPYACGAYTTRSEVDQFFNRLSGYLARRDKAILRELLAESVVVLKNDRARRSSAAALVEAQASVIPIEDWMEISRRGEPGLRPVGWRGCIMSSGRAGFNVDREGRLRLDSYSSDIPWDRE